MVAYTRWLEYLGQFLVRHAVLVRDRYHDGMNTRLLQEIDTELRFLVFAAIFVKSMLVFCCPLIPSRGE